jgi:hypothetical protein
MADLGAVGVGPVPVPTVASFLFPRVPAVFVSFIIANYGQAAGGISIY